MYITGDNQPEVVPFHDISYSSPMPLAYRWYFVLISLLPSKPTVSVKTITKMHFGDSPLIELTNHPQWGRFLVIELCGSKARELGL